MTLENGHVFSSTILLCPPAIVAERQRVSLLQRRREDFATHIVEFRSFSFGYLYQVLTVTSLSLKKGEKQRLLNKIVSNL